MTKKVLLVLVLAGVLAGGISAQEKSAAVKKLWLSGEASLFGAGVRGEFMLTPKLSLGLNAYWTSFFFIFNEVGANAVARLYPWGKTFYAGLGLGLGIHTGTEEIKGKWKVGSAEMEQSGSWFVTNTGFEIVPELGWKIDIGNPGGFFINPHAQLPITIGEKSASLIFATATQFGVSIGFRAACGFGWAL